MIATLNLSGDRCVRLRVVKTGTACRADEIRRRTDIRRQRRAARFGLREFTEVTI